MNRTILTVCAVIFAAVLIYTKNYDFEKSSPTIFYNAKFLTMNEKQPEADAMLVVDGVIQSIGRLDQVEPNGVTNIQRVNLDGATVLPGFIDVHTHFALSLFLANMHDLSGFTHESNEQVWNHLESIASNGSDEDWLVFKGLDPILIADLELPTKDDLDRISPDRPLVILSQSLHSYFANSLAFARAGVDESTPDPSSHSYYGRDENGRLTGLIAEQEAFAPFISVMNREVLTPDMMSRTSVDVMRRYAMNGNTTIVSTGLSISDRKPLVLMEHLSSGHPSIVGNILAFTGNIPKREPAPRHFVYIRFDTPHLLPEAPDEPDYFFDILGVKHWYDGSPYIGSMYMDEPYLVNNFTVESLDIAPGSQGKPLFSKDELKSFIRNHHQNGWQIAIHAQGDAALKDIISVYDELEDELDFSDSDHRLEHCLMLPISTLDDIKRLNLQPSLHINHLYYYGDTLNNSILGAARTQTILPVESALRKNIDVTIHADQPMFDSQPFRLIQTAVQRTSTSGQVIGADQRVDVYDAIKMLTINAARQIQRDDRLGTLETGKYADFIVLDANPLSTAVEDLEHLRPTSTYINGNRVRF